jgi:hypothetical protein
LAGAGQFFELCCSFSHLLAVLLSDVVAQVNAVGAYINFVGAFDKRLVLVIRSAAETAYGPYSLIIIRLFGHWLSYDFKFWRYYHYIL